MAKIVERLEGSKEAIDVAIKRMDSVQRLLRQRNLETESMLREADKVSDRLDEAKQSHDDLEKSARKEMAAESANSK